MKNLKRKKGIIVVTALVVFLGILFFPRSEAIAAETSTKEELAFYRSVEKAYLEELEEMQEASKEVAPWTQKFTVAIQLSKKASKQLGFLDAQKLNVEGEFSGKDALAKGAFRLIYKNDTILTTLINMDLESNTSLLSFPELQSGILAIPAEILEDSKQEDEKNQWLQMVNSMELVSVEREQELILKGERKKTTIFTVKMSSPDFQQLQLEEKFGYGLLGEDFFDSLSFEMRVYLGEDDHILGREISLKREAQDFLIMRYFPIAYGEVYGAEASLRVLEEGRDLLSVFYSAEGVPYQEVVTFDETAEKIYDITDESSLGQYVRNAKVYPFFKKLSQLVDHDLFSGICEKLAVSAIQTQFSDIKTKKEHFLEKISEEETYFFSIPELAENVELKSYKNIPIAIISTTPTKERIDENLNILLYPYGEIFKNNSGIYKEKNIFVISVAAKQDGKKNEAYSYEEEAFFGVQLKIIFPKNHKKLYKLKLGESLEFKEKEIDYKVTLKEVYTFKAPKLTNKFVQQNFGFETVEAFLTDVNKSFRKEFQARITLSMEYGIWDYLKQESVKKEDNKAAITEYYNRDILQTKNTAKKYGIGYKEYLENCFMLTKEEYENGLYQFIESEIDKKMIIAYIAKKENIYLTGAELKKEFQALWESEWDYDYSWYKTGEISQEEVVDKIIEKKVLAFLIEHAKIS